MWLRVLPFLCLFLLSQVSRSQQKEIDVPFDDTTVSGSPFEVSGKLSVRETVAGNEVQSSWEENVTAKNISQKPIVLLVGILDAVGPHSDGGYALIMDQFFSQHVIEPGDTVPLATGTTGRGSCCINPLDKPRDPKAGFRVEFVQFLDGSTFGDPVSAKDALASRTLTRNFLRKLADTYSEQGEQKFEAQVKEGHGPMLPLIRMTADKKGTSAAIAQVREMLAIGEEREAMIGKQATK